MIYIGNSLTKVSKLKYFFTYLENKLIKSKFCYWFFFEIEVNILLTNNLIDYNLIKKEISNLNKHNMVPLLN